MRPDPRRFVLHAALLGVGLGALEVALRVSPLQGLPGPAVLRLVAESVVLTGTVSVALALPLTRWSWRPWGLHLGVLLGLGAAINYRFEVVLNEFVRDPKVWGGVSAAFLLGVAIGLLVDGLIARGSRVLSAVWAAVALASVGAAVVRATPAAGKPGDRPAVVVISLDTLRMDRTSPYGHEVHTPTLDRLAREGAVFTQAIADAPITEPSHLAMLTGISPFRSGIVSNGTNLGDRPALLWRALRDQGYLTAGFVAGFPLHSKYGWAQGLDVFDDDFGATAGVQTLTLVKGWNQFAIKEHALRERPAHQVLDRALPFLRAHAGEQYFAFIHFYDVHGPYDAPGNADLGPPPTDGPALDLPGYWPAEARRVTDPEWLKKAYDKEVELVDDAVAQILEAIGPHLDDTIVVVTADHGESFTEHDYLFDHGDNLYDPSLRIPALYRYPKGVRAGTRIDCQVAGMDLTPTVLALVGVDDGLKRDGHSHAAWLGGEPCDANHPVVASTTYGRFVATPPVAHALRTPVEKVILYDDKPMELFDLAVDPAESTNLAPSGRSRDAEAAFRGLLSTGGAIEGATMDAETCEALKALGYIDGDTPCGPG